MLRPDFALSCSLYTGGSQTAQSVATLNGAGDCDVVFQVVIGHGFSHDHAGSITFRLADNERTKAAGNADFGYMRDYVRDLQSRSGGSAPKL